MSPKWTKIKRFSATVICSLERVEKIIRRNDFPQKLLRVKLGASQKKCEIKNLKKI